MASFPNDTRSHLQKSSKRSFAIVVCLCLCLLTTTVFAQNGVEDAQLQILMPKPSGPHADRQPITIQVNDNGVPVPMAQVAITTRNGVITDREGLSQGTSITYYTDAQ